MKRSRVPFWGFLLGTMLLPWAGAAQQAAPPAVLADSWQGALELPNGPLPLSVTLTEPAQGPRTASLTVPSQKLTGFAFSSVEVRADSLVLVSKFLGVRYAGLISVDKKQLTGIWKQNGAQWPLVLHRGAVGIAPAVRPQEPQLPLPYQEQEVSFINPATKSKLAGTLTLPPGKGPFPAVVLVTGSGPQDRDETILDHHPFRVLADYLTRRGIAVLRYDDRGVGRSAGNYATATTADFLTDAQAALTFLRTQPGVQPKRVGMLGHSEGGTLALLAGAQLQPPAFIVSLAGVGVPGNTLLLRQQADLLRAAGYDTTRATQMRRTQEAVLRIIQSTPDNPPAIAQVVPLLKQVTPGATESMLTTMATQMTSPWYRSFLALHPEQALGKVRVPVLALNGSKDLQVAPDLNLTAIEKGLKAGGNRNVTVQELPGLNHLFQTAKTGLPSEYGQIEETFSPTALQIIGDWIIARTKR